MKHLLDEALGPDFDILKRIGEGKQAEVYLAREKALDRLVAVKVLRAGLAGDEVARGRFEREAKAAAHVNHPNATEVFRFGVLSDGLPYLVLQYVPGRSLEDRIASEGPVSPQEARAILRDVAAALAAAHEHGFVHRDVRPANVLCDAESGQSVLTDFGVAGILPSGTDAAPRLTQTGEFVGDIQHLSPEELKGESASEASDVYALGILAYEILTGGGPFSHLPLSGMIAAQLEGSPPPLSSLLDERDPELEGIVERCLAVEPKRRPGARYVADTLGGTADPRGSSLMDGETPGGDLLASIMRRRLPQFVVVTAGVGWIALEGVSQLVDMGVLRVLWYRVALVTVLFGLVAAGIVTWFHGEKGRQRTSPLEITLLAAVGVGWLLLSLSIILPG